MHTNRDKDLHSLAVYGITEDEIDAILEMEYGWIVDNRTDDLHSMECMPEEV